MFYHVQIHHKHSVDEFKINLTEEELMERIIKPYGAGQPIVINGTTIKLELILRIKIYETAELLDKKVDDVKRKRLTEHSPYAIFNSAPEWVAMETGTNVTDKFITAAPGHMRDKQQEPQKKNGDKSQREKVFIVHGHDNALKDEVSVFLSALQLDPIVLHRQSDGGLTVIEKFEKYANVKYAIVLLTPDDYAYPVSELKKNANERIGKYRARQNVIFELGFFIGKLGRQNVCCLYKGVEIPSDISGLIYKQVDRSVDDIGYQIIKELKAAGLHPQLV
jgi:predicted nucleotide-binding protein